VSGQGTDRPSGRWTFLAAAAALLAISRVHLGLRHDARLYFGDALARLDPQGVGRDLIFAHDGQFGFSVYTPLLARLVAWLGLNGAVMTVSALGLALWLAALLALMSRLLVDLPVAWRRAATVMVIVLAPFYGSHEVFAYGEAFATPRVLVEAVGLAALAAWLDGRRWLAAGLLVAAMALHPIMALCGLGVLLVALCLEDRRWLLAAGAGLIGLLAAAALGAPVANRLLQIMDPVWRAIAEARSPMVFVSLWPVEAWGRLAMQAVTLGLAASLSQGKARQIMTAALIAGLLGVAAAWTADRLSLVLPLQLQLWRTQALMAVLAAAGLAVCLLSLPRRGSGGVMAAAMLVLGWTFSDWGQIPLIASVLAVAATRIPEAALSRPGLVRRGVVGLVLIAVAIWAGIWLKTLTAAWGHTPAEQGLRLALIWSSGLPGWIAAAGAMAFAMCPTWLDRRMAVAGSILLAVVALALWDGRSAYNRWRDSDRDLGLTAILADRPGEVLWLAGDVEPWTLAGRPSWASKLQGAGVVLSRPLAINLGGRIDRLIAGGLANETWRQPFSQKGAPETAPAAPSPSQVAGFCAASDAPAWIVAPIVAGQRADPALRARIFTPPAPYRIELAAGWASVTSYAAIPCAGG
jgi:hypothetical protein